MKFSPGISTNSGVTVYVGPKEQSASESGASVSISTQENPDSTTQVSELPVSTMNSKVWSPNVTLVANSSERKSEISAVLFPVAMVSCFQRAAAPLALPVFLVVRVRTWGDVVSAGNDVGLAKIAVGVLIERAVKVGLVLDLK